MTKTRHNMTLANVALSAALGLWVVGCADNESPSGQAPQHTDLSSATADAGPPQQTDTSSTIANPDAGPPANACIKCPPLLGNLCDQPDVSAYPSYEQFRTELLASCATRSNIKEGRCQDSGLRFLAISYGLGAQRRYFDAEGKFVSATTESDFIDETCRGKKHWPVQVSCNEQTDVQVLCPTAAP